MMNTMLAKAYYGGDMIALDMLRCSLLTLNLDPLTSHIGQHLPHFHKVLQ